MATFPFVINGRRIGARRGDTVLDAALAAHIVIPHDCATGQCNTCRVRLYDGAVDDRGTMAGETVLACRATVTGPAVIEFDEVPAETSRRGAIASIRDLAPDICEVTVELGTRLIYLPGQYVKVSFGGYPSRDYSPTFRNDGSGELHELIFHVRRQAPGSISSKLGGEIKAGSPVRVVGPFGHAYHRLGIDRLVLVSSGVGWAPVWAVARASRLREPARELVVVAGARHAANLYMRPALDWLRERGADTALTCSGADAPSDAAPGRTTAYLPTLRPTDTVVVAGLPAMVEAVQSIADVAGATCFADPFLPAKEKSGIRDRLRIGLSKWMRTIGATTPIGSTQAINGK